MLEEHEIGAETYQCGLCDFKGTHRQYIQHSKNNCPPTDLICKVESDDDDSPISEEGSIPEISEAGALKQEISDLKEQVLKLTAENARLKQLNFQLQEKVIDKFKVIEQIAESPRKHLPKRVRLSQPPATNSKIETCQEMAPGTRVNGNVHLGRGIFLPSLIFDNIFTKQKVSIFIKDLARALFGDEVLTNSSITGSRSNRAKNSVSRPPLNPTKLLAMQDILKVFLKERLIPEEKHPEIVASMKRILNEKIQDLRKKAMPGSDPLLNFHIHKNG